MLPLLPLSGSSSSQTEAPTPGPVDLVVEREVLLPATDRGPAPALRHRGVVEADRRALLRQAGIGRRASGQSETTTGWPGPFPATPGAPGLPRISYSILPEWGFIARCATISLYPHVTRTRQGTRVDPEQERCPICQNSVLLSTPGIMVVPRAGCTASSSSTVLSAPECRGRQSLEFLERGRRRNAGERLIAAVGDAPVDRERCMVVAAVDVGRDDLPGLLPDHGKDPADGGGLPGPRWPAEDGREGAPAPERGADEEGEFPDLGVTVVEVLGDERELEDVRVPEEGLVATEKRGMCHKRDWRRGSR